MPRSAAAWELQVQALPCWQAHGMLLEAKHLVRLTACNALHDQLAQGVAMQSSNLSKALKHHAVHLQQPGQQGQLANAKPTNRGRLHG